MCDKRQPLHVATAKGNCNYIRLLVEEGWSVEHTDKFSQTPLHTAIRCDQHEVAELLLDLGADCNASTGGGISALELAIIRNNYKIVQMLLYRNVTVDHHHLLEALERDRWKIMDILLAADNSTIDVADSDGYNLLTQSILTQKNIEFVNVLIRHKCNVNGADKNGWTALHHAVHLNKINIVDILLKSNANCRLLTLRKLSTMYLAVCNNNLDMVNLLLPHGDNKSSRCRLRILNGAVQSDSAEIAEVLVRKYENLWSTNHVNALDGNGNTLLMLAVAAGQHFAVKVLLSRGADVTLRDRSERDALYLSVWKKRTDIARTIVNAAGYRRYYERRNVSRQIALYPNVLFSAIDSNLYDVIELLLKSASVEEMQEKNTDNRNILHVAVIKNDHAIISLIKKYCTNSFMNQLDSFGHTPFTIAIESMNFELVLLLLSDEINQTVDSILMRDIKIRNVEGIKALVCFGIYVNKSLIHASIDLERSEMYDVHENYDLDLGDRLEDSIVGILIGCNLKYFDIVFEYALETLKYNIIHKLHYAGYVFEMNEERYENIFLRMLWENGKHSNTINIRDCDSLDIHQAVEKPFAVFILIFIRYWLRDENFDAVDSNRETSLQKAIRLGNLEAAAVLIQHGAKLKMGSRKLSECRLRFNESFCNLLIEAGAGCKQHVLSLLRLTRIALRKDSNRFKKIWNTGIDYGLIEYDYKYDMEQSFCGKTALEYAIKNNMNTVVNGLLKGGADPQQLDENDKTPLSLAISKSITSSDIVKMLITAAPETINNPDYNGMTPLLHSAYCDDAIILQTLIDAGANLNHVNKNGDSALNRAIIGNRPNNISLLLKHGADPKHLNGNGHTPLMTAASICDTNVINMLIDAASDAINTSDSEGMTPLLHAAYQGDANTLQALIYAGSNLKHFNDKGESVLHRSSAGNKPENISLFLNHGADPRQLDNRGRTPLIAAASGYKCNTIAITMLINAAPDMINVSDEDGMTALLHAAHQDDIKTLKTLIDAGSNVNHVNKKGENALHISGNKSEHISLFLKHGVDPLQLDENGRTPLMAASSECKSKMKVITMLIDAALDALNTSDDDGMTPLLNAASNDDINILRTLIEAGSNINHINKHGENVLHRTIAANKPDNISLFLKHGADPLQLDDKGRTPLIAAASKYSCNTLVITRLINAAPDNVNTPDVDGMTALLHTAHLGDVSNLKALIDAGSNLNHVNKKGESALHRVSIENEREIISLLLKFGADPRLLNINGCTPLITATSRKINSTDAIRTLIEAAPDVVNTPDDDGMTALLHTAQQGDADTLKALIDAGSNLNHVNKKGDSALHTAIAANHPDCVSLLLKHGADPRLLNHERRTPLLTAAALNQCNSDIIDMLINAAKDVVNNADDQGMTALLHTAHKDNIRNIMILLDAGSDFYHVNSKNQSACDIFEACNRPEYISLFTRYAENVPDEDGMIPILHYAYQGNVHELAPLIDSGSNLDHVNKKGESALHRACAGNKSDNISLLLIHGANPRIIDCEGRTPLIAAAQLTQCNPNIITMLIIAARDVVNTADHNGMTALLHAASNDDINIIKTLIEGGSNLNHVNKYGESVLHRASADNNPKYISLFLSHGANPRLLDVEGRTPLIAASKSQLFNDTVITMLINAAPEAVYTMDDDEMTPFLHAAFNGKIKNLEPLINAGSNINHTNKMGQNALHIAIVGKKSVHISFLLKHGVDPRQIDHKGYTPLIAAASEHTCISSTITTLINAAPDVVNTPDIDGMTALLHAAYQGDINSLNSLINAGSDLLKINNLGESALHIASAGNIHVNVSLFLNHGANPRQLDNEGHTPLIAAASSYKCNQAVISLLVSAAPDVVDASDNDGMTALLHAAYWGDTPTLKTLIDAGSNLNHVNKRGESILHRASAGKYPENISMLLNLGADPRCLDYKGRTPLIAAASGFECKPSAAIMLIYIASDVVNISDIDGMTALLHSAYWGDSNTFEALIDAGSDLNHVNELGESALHRASAGNMQEHISMLLKLGADPRRLDYKGRTPLIAAATAYRCNSAVIAMLIHNAPDVINTSDNDGMTALLHAAYQSDLDTFKTLIEAGSNLNHVNKKGESALHIASAGKNDKNVSLLLKLGADPRHLDNRGRTPLIAAASASKFNTTVVTMSLDPAPYAVYKLNEDEKPQVFDIFYDLYIYNALFEGNWNLNCIDKTGELASDRVSMLKSGMKEDSELIAVTIGKRNSTAVIKMLVEAAPDVVNNSDDEGMIAFLYSAYWGYVRSFQILIDAGSDVYHLNKYGDNAIDLARYNVRNKHFLQRLKDTLTKPLPTKAPEP